MNGVPTLLMVSVGGFALLAGMVIWGMSVLSAREKREARISAVVAPHLPARFSARPRAPRRPLWTFLPVRQLALLLGFDTTRTDEYRVPWWAVLLVAIPVARIIAGLAASVVSEVAMLALPLFWVLVCRLAFRTMLARRRAALFRQFPDALGMLTRMVRVGIPVTESMRVIARDSPKPTAMEFQRIADRLSIGIPLDQALAETARRNAVPEYRFFSTALSLQAQTGGALSEALDNLADVIRRRIALRQRGIALAGEAKTSAAILGSLPFFTVGLLMLVAPDHARLLFEDKDGQRILGAAMLQLGVGWMTMQHMIKKALS